MKEARRLYVDEGYANGSTHNSVLDGAFRNVQKNTSAFLIWRIENMSVIALPKDQYGTFYTGDSYIIYAASQYGIPSGTEAVSREIRNGPLEYHIHFWLGAETTSDKSGVAAYKTVELDGHLGGIATQHRETQGNESARFKSYFKNGFKVLKGGTESGFKNSLKNFEVKLYRVKGKRIPIITQEENVSWSFFNSGDVFLVITPQTIFVWIGRAANGVEKLHAAKTALSLKTEYNIANIVFVDDGYEKTLPDDEKKEFSKYLPLEKRVVYPPDHGGDDAEKERQHKTNLRLYCCSDNSGKYRVAEVKSGPVLQTDLNADDVYILDTGLNGIWVWVGKRASEKERSEALRNARGFVKKKSYPNNTRVTRVVDGAEPTEFKMLFSQWKDKDEIKVITKNHAATAKATKVTIAKFDAITMHERPTLAAESQLVDDGSGTIQIWRITKANATEIPQNRHGIFYAGDCYLILYAYEATSPKSIIYYWMGSQATPENASWVAMKATEMNQELGGKSVQVKVVEGHEPPHFLQLFKGKMVVFRGKATDYEDNGRSSRGPPHYLLQIVGSSTYTAKAVHVNCKAAALNSNYCYILKRHKHYYIWCGSYSTGDQREIAKGFVGKDFDILLEGKETPEFWGDLGGEGSYTTKKIVDNSVDSRPARLFQCSTATGEFKVEEIMNFTQNDLIPEDVMLLDARNTIFIWLGNLSTKEEKKLTFETAENYLKSDPAGRDICVPITEITQGNEPPNFIGFFNTWDSSLWTAHKSFEQFRNELEGSNTTLISMKERKAYIEDSNFDQYIKYPINVLTAASDKLPSKVDPLKKEVHLTHDDFVSLFKINYGEFENLPKWKQQEMKKRVGLF